MKKLPLKKGSKGPEVEALQKLLNLAFGESLAVDGDFWRKTVAAVDRAWLQLGYKDKSGVGVTREFLLLLPAALGYKLPPVLEALLSESPLDDAQLALWDTYQSAKVKPEWRKRVEAERNEILHFRKRYEEVTEATGVPWILVGIIHQLEADGWWSKHLHNGDPLSSRTKQVPRGRPKAPPANGKSYTWLESAVDAVRYDEMDKIPWESYKEGSKEWIAIALDEMERYNGLGYRHRGKPSPYLWSGSSAYVKGKYVADNKYSPNAVSQQTGAGLVLRAILDKLSK